jgi:hypothetical protein
VSLHHASTGREHVFVLPVYGRPHWLERCPDSQAGQTAPSPVVTASTRSAHLAGIGRRRGNELKAPPVSAGIAADWNIALLHATRPWVTLAHQDDWLSSLSRRRYAQVSLLRGVGAA